MKFIKTILIILASIILLFGLLIGYATISKYKPQKIEIIESDTTAPVLPDTMKLSLLTWNIGYGGLGNDMDFFYDGGTHVRTSKSRTIQNLDKISSFLKSNDTIDFILLQEADMNSKRTYYISEPELFTSLFTDRKIFFGKNYDVFFVPVPPTSPMGKVVSGIITISKFEPVNVSRYAYPGKFDWPKRLFILDRCFMVSRFKLKNNKDLVLINTHNSAFDETGVMKKQEMAYLKEYLLNEYQSGNYIVVGGDWNQSPPLFKPVYSNFDKKGSAYVEKDLMPGNWNWVYDSITPSNRSVVTPYIKGKTLTTTIDFYLLSPNIQKLWVKTINLDFENSDHNPVMIQLELKK